MRLQEWERLVKRFALKRLQEASVERLRAHKGWIVVGDFDLLAHVIGFEVPRANQREVSTYANVLSLYEGDRTRGDFHLDIGGDGRGHQRWVLVAEDDPASAMEVLTDGIIDEGLPHLAKYPDLESVADHLSQLLREDPESQDLHLLRRLALTQILLDQVKEAAWALSRLLKLLNASQRSTPWRQDLQTRASRMLELLQDDPDLAKTELREAARSRAKELKLPV